MDRLPCVSVIMPVKNMNPFFFTSLESIIHQDYPSLEIIIIYDNDDFIIDKKYKEEPYHKILIDVYMKYVQDKKENINIKFIDNKENKGCFKARMRGISEATSDFIMLQDSDDFSLQNRLSLQMDVLLNNRKIWAVGGWADKIDDLNNSIGSMMYPPETTKDIIQFFIGIRQNPMIDSSVVFRKKIFLKLKGYDTSFPLVADMDLWLKSLVNGYQMCNLQQEIIRYRVHDNSNTIKYKKEMIREHILVFNKYRHKLLNL